VNNKGLGVAFLVVGLCLLAYGFSAADSVASDFSRFFNGTPTNKSLMLLILGGVFTVLGISSFKSK
jgi:hypothetical protein